jgi:hypothetical protein
MVTGRVGMFGVAGRAGEDLLSGAGSINVKVSPLFASFTSVSILPSGFLVAFTIVTVRSGCPWNFSVRLSPDFGKSSATTPAVSITPAATAHAHRFQVHRIMVISQRSGPRGHP